MKKTPQRMCIACRQMYDKNALMRIVKSADGTVSLDATGKKSGRGAYICNAEACVNKCVKAKLIHKAFSLNADAELYGRIAEEFKQNQNK
ncbi:MAG: YlxR family protein [Firmicutes bacterium]|nr:YlxR family protein [Bacillota bacterium]